jgi:hypothetical protein
MSPIFLKKAFTIFSVSGKFLKSLLANAGNSWFSDMRNVLQASWVTAEDPIFKKSLQNEVRWHDVWGLLWPNAMPNNVVTEDALQKGLCCVYSRWVPDLAETSNPVHSLIPEQ